MKKCKCGGTIKTYMLKGKNKFGPYFNECDKCLKVYKVRTK